MKLTQCCARAPFRVGASAGIIKTQFPNKQQTRNQKRKPPLLGGEQLKTIIE